MTHGDPARSSTGTGGCPDESGPLLFARYAYPPNALGYCGPEDHRALFEYGTERVVDRGLLELARGFEGAWPYLELIAGANGITDPLDRRVVEAYWVGNDLLERVDLSSLGRSVQDRFRRGLGRSWARMADVALSGGVVPHHSFHVLLLSPWMGLMRAGHPHRPLEVMDRCRIRWGRVVDVEGGLAAVRVRPLAWDGGRLMLGPSRLERAMFSRSDRGFAPNVRPGEWVSLHWDWVCDRLDPRSLAALRRYTARQMAAANAPAGSLDAALS